MSWNRVSWILVAACIAAATLFVVKTARTQPVAPSVPPPPPPIVEPPPAPVEEPPAIATGNLPDVCRPLLGQGVKNFPATHQEQIDFCTAWTEIVNRAQREPVPVDDDCGPPAVVASLRALDTCAKLSDVCESHGASTARVDVKDILAVSDRFPVQVSYFDSGSHDLHGSRELMDFVRRQLGGDEQPAFMIFGSASPTARDADVDIRLARARTEAAFKVVNRVLRDNGRFLLLTRKANIGRGLAEDVCDAMGEGTAARQACQALDVNARRQASFVVAYPRRCLEGGH